MGRVGLRRVVPEVRAVVGPVVVARDQVAGPKEIGHRVTAKVVPNVINSV